MFCHQCGARADDGAQFCTSCGARLHEGRFGPEIPPQVSGGPEPKQKLLAGILGIALGWLGVHRFYLGYNTVGALQLALGVAGIFTCGVTTVAAWIWGIVDGVQILTGTITTDAQGVPLRD